MLHDEGGPHISVAAGITVGLFASFVQSLGLTIQRKSHVLNQLLAESEQRVEHRRPLWLLGFAIFISSNILGSLFQIASLPVVILAPLGAVSLLWNAFFARLLLGDVFSPWMVVGTFLIAGGAILIAVFGIVPEPTRSVEDLLALFNRPAFIAYFSLLGAALLGLLIITHAVEYSLFRRSISVPQSPPMSPVLFPQASSPLAPPTTERTPLLDRKPPASTPSRPSTPALSMHGVSLPSHTRLLLAVSYASASGILSGMCLLFAKSGVQLLVLTISGDNQFWRWQAWMLLLGLSVFALLQLWYLHKSLILADPTLVCPLAFCFYNLSSIVNGLVYFDQFSMISPLHLVYMVIGIIVLLGGVWAVSVVQSDGGGVDVGTWQEGGDEIVNDVVDVPAVSPPASPPTITLDGRGLGHVRSATSPPSSTLTTVAPALLPPTPFPSTQVDGSISPASSRTFSAFRRVKGPSIRRRFPSGQDVGGGAIGASHLLPGGGFSIGLSPVSPGFALVPRRRVSGVGGGVMAVSEVASGVGMRRTVSEGDVNQTDRRVECGGAEQGGGGAAGGGDGEGGKSRWRWVQEVFRV